MRAERVDSTSLQIEGDFSFLVAQLTDTKVRQYLTRHEDRCL
jgi:hypothetical protein